MEYRVRHEIEPVAFYARQSPPLICEEHGDERILKVHGVWYINNVIEACTRAYKELKDI